MKIDGNSVRPGNIIEFENRLWVVVKTQHTQPGKGGAYMQVELKGVKDGVKKNERFRSDQKIELVRLDTIPHQFLFEEGGEFIFMNQDTFEQVPVREEIVGEGKPFLQEGMVVELSFYEGEVLSVKVPEKITMMVVEAEMVVRGQTASASYKPARLENGVTIMVPPHIEAGTRVVVNTQDVTYVERAKS